MEISELVTPDAVLAELKAASKRQVLQELATAAAPLCGLHEQHIFEALLERERLGTTGVGHGVAIPHARLPSLDRLYGVFAHLTEPVEFDAIDDEPVDLVFLLLAPEGAGADHLKALARISRLLRDSALCAALRATRHTTDLHALLTHPPQSHAA
ncbi:MAG: PTS IIA-like nitrogen regulatory protein PtsN [Alphaproteobacteria bacterium]|nr:PTS IIA-like nitrogen regulatory protein PtsN [Alphaproteobacteria bacterium]